MLIDWTSGNSRWIVTGVFSLIVHIVLLGLLVSTSESDEPRAEEAVASQRQAGDAPPAADGAAAFAASSPSRERDALAVTDRNEPSAPPPLTPETAGAAEQGTLDAIGKSFDETSARVRNAGSLAERKAEAPARKGERRAETRKTPARKVDKVEKKPPAGQPAAEAPASAGAEAGYAWRVVKRGESLTRIAQEYGMTPLALAQLNGYKKPLSVRLRVGQKIKVRAK